MMNFKIYKSNKYKTKDEFYKKILNAEYKLRLSDNLTN